MSSKNISIRDEAYDFLQSMKGENQSFSEVILGFKAKEKDKGIMRFFGAMPDAEFDEEAMKELRDSFNRRLK